MPVFRVASSSPYAPVIGLSSAVRAGNLVFVAGTTAVDSSGAVIGGDDPYAQTQEALRKISAMLAEAGTDLSHVVQTRMYLVRSEHWEHVGRAHGEVFAENSPAATMVVVAGCSTHACLLRSKPSPIAVYDYQRPPRCACGSVHETPADSRFCAGLWRTPRTEADDDKCGHRTTRGP
jgi:enamine deaminase RidA (YjgF/YER057c/UK114 family)